MLFCGNQTRWPVWPRKVTFERNSLSELATLSFQANCHGHSTQVPECPHPLHSQRNRPRLLFKLAASDGTSLVVQWLRLHAPNAGGPGSIPGQEIRYHTWQLSRGAAKKKTRTRIGKHTHTHPVLVKYFQWPNNLTPLSWLSKGQEDTCLLTALAFSLWQR